MRCARLGIAEVEVGRPGTRLGSGVTCAAGVWLRASWSRDEEAEGEADRRAGAGGKFRGSTLGFRSAWRVDKGGEGGSGTCGPVWIARVARAERDSASSAWGAILGAPSGATSAATASRGGGGSKSSTVPGDGPDVGPDVAPDVGSGPRHGPLPAAPHTGDPERRGRLLRSGISSGRAPGRRFCVLRCGGSRDVSPGFEVDGGLWPWPAHAAASVDLSATADDESVSGLPAGRFDMMFALVHMLTKCLIMTYVSVSNVHGSSGAGHCACFLMVLIVNVSVNCTRKQASKQKRERERNKTAGHVSVFLFYPDHLAQNSK